MNKKIIIGVLALAAVVWGIVIMTPSKDQPAVMGDREAHTTKLKVAASFYPLYFFSKEIGGDMAEVMNITPAGAEPHEYEPTAQDMVSMQNSALLVFNGGGLEPWSEDVEKNLGANSKTSVVFASEGLVNQIMVEDGETMPDPHVWLSPALAKLMVDNITEGFVSADRENSGYYRANSEALKARLDALDLRFRTGLGNCAHKNIVTSHAAFIYLATAYNLKQVPITGISPEDEPSAREMAEISKFAKDNNIKYIFFESLVSPKLAETIAREIGAQTLVLNPLEGLTKEEISAGKNYFTEMEANLVNLKIALECKN